MTEKLEIFPKIVSLLRRSEVGRAWLQISDRFDKADVYLAGGSIRDLLLERDVSPTDFDFFLGGAAQDEIFSHLAEIGTIHHGPFGSPRWVPSRDANHYCDVIPIGDFFNGLWRCEDILDVLNQFDFTANAVAVHLRTGVLHDPQNGRRDCSLRVMRAIRFDYPDEPISQSIKLTRPAVVWFRILHYAAQLGFTIEPVTLEWMRRHSFYAGQLNDFVETFFPLDPKALAQIEELIATT
jgi:hypothetical protein